MSEMTQVPTKVWMQVVSQLQFLTQTIQPLARGFKRSQWMTAEEIMSPSDPQYLKIGRERLKQLRASGVIEWRKGGKHIEYLRKDIEAYKNGDIRVPTKRAQKVQ